MPGQALMPDTAPPPIPAGTHALWQVGGLLALDPLAFGGVVVRAPCGDVRSAWLSALRSLGALPSHRLPPGCTPDSLTGGLDLTATLASGIATAQSGLLARAHGGWLEIAMAERLTPMATALIAQALDTGHVRLEREGLSRTDPARFAVLALDEGEDAEAAPEALCERLAFRVDLSGFSLRSLPTCPWSADALRRARARLPDVTVSGPLMQAADDCALSLGVGSLRAVMFVMRAARGLAALAGRMDTQEDDLIAAARLVLSHRARQLPQIDAPDTPPPPETSGDPPPDAEGEEGDPSAGLRERIIAAIASGSIALGVDPARQRPDRARGAAGVAGKTGRVRLSFDRGRPLAARPGHPRQGGRLDLPATLRAAAPWQRLRGGPDPVRLRARDFRLKRFRLRARSTVIFIVDASGSAALSRLGEAKGAVERLLADCHARRDQVALITFRGEAAQTLLPPTRALTTARRALAQAPAGGGTPLAGALLEAARLALAERQRQHTPLLVLLTDGRGNIGLAGARGSEPGTAEALETARQVRVLAFRTLLFDTSARPDPRARALAEALGATYQVLPPAGAQAVFDAVRAASQAGD